MRAFSALATALVIGSASLAALAACGLTVDANGPAAVLGDDGGARASDASPFGAEGAAAADAAPAPSGTSCGAPPTGWTRTGLSSDPAILCPLGTDPTDLVASAKAAADACSCACTITAHQSCAAGDVETFYDNGSGNCETKASKISNSPAGSCDDQQNDFYISQHFKGTPPPPSGASACTGTATLAAAKVTKTTARTCVPVDGNTCAVAPLADCVSAPGDVACPAGPYATKHALMTDVSASCGACGGCAVTTTCKGTVLLSGSSACGSGVTVNVDNVCYAVPYTTNLRYSKYIGTATETCTLAAPPPAAVLTPAGTTTVCCR